MGSTRRPWSLLLIALLGALVTAPNDCVAKEIIIATAFGAPFHTPAGDGRLDRLLSEAFRDIGEQVRVVEAPAERGLLNANSGLDDGDGPRVAGLEAIYPNLVMVPERVMRMAFVGFTRRPALTELVGWASLAPYDVGIVRGWKILERNIEARNLVSVRTPAILFGLLGRDRVDVVVFARRFGWMVARRAGLDDVREVGTFAEKDMYLYLHRRHAALVEPLARGLRAMKEDGRFAKILEEAP